MKVLVAEDLESVREHLRARLVKVENVDVRFVAQEAMLVMQAMHAWRPEVAVLDNRMRGKSALNILETFKATWPETAVVVYATLFDPFYRETYLKYGADFFFDKLGDWGELITFLRVHQASVFSDEHQEVDERDRHSAHRSHFGLMSTF